MSPPSRPVRWVPAIKASCMGFATGAVIGSMVSVAHMGRVNPQGALFLGTIIGVGGALRAA